MNRKPNVVFLGVAFGRFFMTENRLFGVGFSVAKKKRNRKIDFVLAVGIVSPVPYINSAHVSA